jgi:hypothetical protein
MGKNLEENGLEPTEVPRGAEANHENSGENIEYLSRDSNWASPEYESRVLLLLYPAPSISQNGEWLFAYQILFCNGHVVYFSLR